MKLLLYQTLRKNLLAYVDASNFGFVTDAMRRDPSTHYNYRPEKATLTLVSDLWPWSLLLNQTTKLDLIKHWFAISGLNDRT
jgi:hypothetical protein